MSSDSNAGNYFDLNFIKNLKNLNEDHGYLVCHKCYGYYPLKENELPSDFLECECGNNLEFYENIDDLLKIEGLKNSDETNSEILHDNELQEISNVLKSKSEKRKEFLKNLSTRIKMQEEVLNEINYGKGKFWDTTEEKMLYNNIDAQNYILENAVEKENNFLSYVKEQRSRAERTENHYFIKISSILFVISAFMLLTLLL